MLKFIKTKKGVAMLATLVVVGAAAFGAYAYFTAGGSGNGLGDGGNVHGHRGQSDERPDHRSAAWRVDV